MAKQDKTESPTRNATAPATAPRKDDPEQTWVIGHDGKRYKSEDYRETDEFKGKVKD